MKRVKVGVGAILIKDGKLLLGLRNPDSKKADSELHGEGTWTMPGGGVEFGESLEDTIRREVYEECGIKVYKTKFVSLSVERVHDAHFITLGFLCEQFSGEPEIREEDIVEWKWFELNKLPKNLFIATKNILNNYFAGRVYAGED